MARPSHLSGWLAAWLMLIAGQAWAADGQPVWRTDFAKAQAEAEERQVPLLAHFYATWCLPCSQMDRDVFRSDEVQQLLSDQFVGVKIDSDQHPELSKRFHVERLPTDLFIDPMTGRVLIEKQGATFDVKEYLSLASRADAKFQQALKFHLAKQAPNVVDQPDAVAKLNELRVELGQPKPLVGLDGFSPVSLTKYRKWIRGSAEFTWDYQGVTYQLASRAEQLEFRKDPEAFAPRILGCDPVTLFETDRAVPGRTQYGAFYDDELYLFTSAENRKRFKANPQRFMKTQHVLKIDHIDRTAMLDGSHLK
jgi:YHS domain-containing protein